MTESGLSTVNDMIQEERRKKIALAAKKAQEQKSEGGVEVAEEPKKRRKRRWFKKPADTEEQSADQTKKAKRSYKKRGPKPEPDGLASPFLTRQEYDRLSALVDAERDSKMKALKILFGYQE